MNLSFYLYVVDLFEITDSDLTHGTNGQKFSLFLVVKIARLRGNAELAEKMKIFSRVYLNLAIFIDQEQHFCDFY